jgi:hypothetical protein
VCSSGCFAIRRAHRGEENPLEGMHVEDINLTETIEFLSDIIGFLGEMPDVIYHTSVIGTYACKAAESAQTLRQLMVDARGGDRVWAVEGNLRIECFYECLIDLEVIIEYDYAYAVSADHPWIDKLADHRNHFEKFHALALAKAGPHSHDQFAAWRDFE